MTKVPTNTFQNYIIYLFLMFEIVGTAWICGSNDHALLRTWFTFTMITLFVTRLYSFYKKGYLLYLWEMCYFVNLVSIPMIYNDIGMNYIYPFLHGPLIAYSLIFGDALILHDLDKTTSLAIHSFGAIITRRLYWQGDQSLILSLEDLTLESFGQQMLVSIGCYLLWVIPYCIFYLFPFNGSGHTMIRYTTRLDENGIVTTIMKAKYIVLHMLLVVLALLMGNLAMYIWQFDYVLIISQIICGVIHGGWHYYKEHKFKFEEAQKDLMKSINTHLKLKEIKDTNMHLQVEFEKNPKIVVTNGTLNKSICIDSNKEKYE